MQMERFGSETKSSHLPPVEVAPILESYDPALTQVAGSELLEPIYHDSGIVDVDRTVDMVLSHVEPDYEWPRDRMDVHHFQWERRDYHPDNWQGDKIPALFRETPSAKGYVPRQFHNFVHAVTAQPEMPDYDVMEQEVYRHKIQKSLFEAARQVYVADRHPERSLKGKWFDSDDIDYTILSKKIEVFDQRIEQLADDELIEEITRHNSLDQIGTAARSLGRLVGRQNVNLLPKISRHQKARSL